MLYHGVKTYCEGYKDELFLYEGVTWIEFLIRRSHLATGERGTVVVRCCRWER
jgi:hypothetical protein